MADERIGDRIRRYREANGLTQTALATLIGVPQSRVSDWEKHKHIPEPPNILALSAALRILPTSLTTDEYTRQWMAPVFKGNPKPLKLGSTTVENIFVIVGDGREPLELTVKYSHEPLYLHPKIRAIYPQLAAMVKERALSSGAAFWDGPIVRLIRITESGSHQHSGGFEQRGIELELAPVSWTQFSVLNMVLDEPGFFGSNPLLTIRDALVDESLLYSFPTDFSWCALSNMLTICMMPVTSDGYGFVQRRSGSVSAAPRKLISGVSENMHRWLDEAPAHNLWNRVHPLVPASKLPGKVDAEYRPANGNVPSPFLTVQRGFQEELAPLRPLMEAAATRVKFLSVVVDMSLFQPVLVGVIDVPYEVRELENLVKENRGKDHSEWTELIPVKLSRSDAETVRMVSNIRAWDLGGLAALMTSIRYAEAIGAGRT